MTHELDKFDPTHFDLRNKSRDLAIEKRARLKDWPRLEEDVDEKIEEIESFCSWWKTAVTKNYGGDRKSSIPIRILEPIEKQTGVTQPTVSKWRKELKNKPKFRGPTMQTRYLSITGQSSRRSPRRTESEFIAPTTTRKGN